MSERAALIPQRLRTILRDLFRTAQAPAVSGDVQGGDQVTVGSLLSQIDGLLRGGGQSSSPAWGASRRTYAAVTRASGRCLAVLISPEDKDALMAAGFAPADPTGNPTATGYGWANDEGRRSVIIPGQLAVLEAAIRNIRPTDYLLVICLNTTGAMIGLAAATEITGWGVTGPLAVPAWPTLGIQYLATAGSDAALVPYLSFLDTIGYPRGHAISQLRVLDVLEWRADGWASFADRVQRPDSLTSPGGDWTVRRGVWGVNANRLYVQTFAVVAPIDQEIYTDAGIADLILAVDITMPSAHGGNPGLAVRTRRVDASNHQRWQIDNAAIYLDIVVGGAVTRLAGVARTWTAGQTYRFVFMAKGNQYFCMIDGAIAIGWTADPANNFLMATGIAMINYDFGGNLPGYFTNILAAPHTISLPRALRSGAHPMWHPPGAVITSASFTAANGTRLSTLGFTEALGEWEVQSNRAVLRATGRQAGINAAIQDIGRPDYQAAITIHTPGSFPTGYIGAGMAVRWADDQNFVMVQLIMSPLQPGSDEVELIEMTAGVGPVVHKCNLGAAVTINTSYQLAVQCVGGLLQVTLDATILLSYRLVNPLLLAATLAGPAIEGYDDGCGLDDWTVQAL